MKKNIGVVPAVYPMPVLMVAAYDANGKVNVMNVAWGQICDMDKIILFIGDGLISGKAKPLLLHWQMKLM